MRLQSIQALRALAAYLVLLYHIRAQELMATGRLRDGKDALISGVFENGYAGVDLFFVISGFIMVFVSAGKPESLGTVKDFLIARIFRIFPPWWLFAGIMAVYLFISYGVPWDAKALAIHENTGPNHLIRSFFLLPQPNFPVLGVGWTLVHEIFFYAVFSLLLLAPRKLLPAWLGVWALFTLAGALSGFASPFASDFLHLIFHTMTLEFIAGAFAGWLYVSGIRWRPGLVLIFGGGLFIAVLWFSPYPTPFTLSWGRALIFTLPCVLMVYGAAGVAERFQGRIAGILARLGDYSYALYLSHILVLATLARALPYIGQQLTTRFGLPEPVASWLTLGSPGYGDNLVFIVVGIIACTIFSALAYHLFEQPVLKALSRFRRKRPQ